MKPGYYWAQWRIPADGTHEGELQTPSNKWEIVQVWANSVNWENSPEEDEALCVYIPGVRETQHRDCFVWGELFAPLQRPETEAELDRQIEALEARRDALQAAKNNRIGAGVADRMQRVIGSIPCTME